jgi:uncharacterized lipoprotein YmbA
MKRKFSIHRIPITPVFFLCLLLGGCISVPTSPTARFYTLQPIKEIGGIELAGAGNLSNLVLGVGPVSLPEYLNRPQIVTRRPDNTVEFAQFDRWAEPLDAGVARLIAKNFSVLLPTVNVEIFPWNSVIPVKYQVIMEVIQLDCKLDSEAILLLQWSVVDAKEKSILLAKRSEYRKPIEGKNYYSLVQTVSSILDSTSREIAQALAQLATPSSQ